MCKCDSIWSLMWYYIDGIMTYILYDFTEGRGVKCTAAASEHLHQGHKEDTCLIRSASLQMSIKPRSGKRLDEWSCIPDSLRFLTTKRNTDWYRHVWIDRWSQASWAGVTKRTEHSNPKGGLEETVRGSSQAKLDKEVSESKCVFSKEWNSSWRWEQTNSFSCYWLNVAGLLEKQSNLSISQLDSHCNKSEVTTEEILWITHFVAFWLGRS